MSKTFTISSKRWGTVQEFLTEFPHLKVSLFLSMIPWIETAPSNIPSWERSKRILVHTNNVKYAYSKQLPISFNFNLKDTAVKVVPSFRDDTGVLQITRRTYPGIRDDYGTIRQWIVTHGGHAIWSAPNKFLGEFSFGAYVYTMFKFLYPEYFKTFSTMWNPQYIKSYHLINTYWSDIIDLFFSQFVIHFEAYSSEVPVSFTEHYGVTDFSKLSPNSISYVVTDSGPPLPDKLWQGVNFWSQLFDKPEGYNLLQAVSELYPISATINASQFKDPGGIFSSASNKSGSLIITKLRFQYIFNNFSITVDKDLKIIIRYKRRVIDETITYTESLKKTWSDYVGMVILIGGVMIATWGVGSAIAGMLSQGGTIVGGSTVVPTTALPTVPVTSVVPVSVVNTTPLAISPFTASPVFDVLVTQPAISSGVAASSTSIAKIGAVVAKAKAASAVLTPVISTGLKVAAIKETISTAKGLNSPENFKMPGTIITSIKNRSAQSFEVKPVLLVGGVGLLVLALTLK